MKTEILKVKGDWQEVADDCRHTVSKGELGKEPSTKFKKMMMICEHSPIRAIHILWRWKSIPSWVSVHWVRHMWECYVSTSRSDRTGIDRNKLPQDTPVDFRGDANTQNLIDTHRKRLCYQASPETRELAEDFKIALHDVEPIISDALVPNCVYRFGCPEQNACGLYKRVFEMDKLDTYLDIQTRYDVYNKFFYKERGMEWEPQND